MNEYVLVNYNVSIRRDNDLAINITRRLNFPGAENLYTSKFKWPMTDKEVLVVVKLVTNSGIKFWTPVMIARF